MVDSEKMERTDSVSDFLVKAETSAKRQSSIALQFSFCPSSSGKDPAKTVMTSLINNYKNVIHTVSEGTIIAFNGDSSYQHVQMKNEITK